MTFPTRAARRVVTLVLVSLATLLAVAPPASAFSLGFNDDDIQRYSGWLGSAVNEPALAAGLANGQRAGAKEWRFRVLWYRVARGSATAPSPSSLAADPAWPGYVWDDVDLEVRAITAAGMTPIPWVARAPAWAEGSGRPPVDRATSPAGTWKPSARQLEQFAKALARRYDGTYPDPKQPGATLPKISTFMAWNEPNLYTEITPQWTKSKGKWKMASVGIYRNLLNGFYKGVKASQKKATVLSAGTGPFGDLYAGERRIQPAAFYRELFCVVKSRGRLVAKSKCPKIKLDGWAHHTYPIGPPTRTARNADDVVVPDMRKLTKIMDAAKKRKIVSSKAVKNLWMTEMSWESQPDPNGLSLDQHAQYMQGAFYVLWKAGVKHVIWWQSRDMAEGKDWNETHQSGVFARGADPSLDTPKPAFTAFKFPFTAYRSKGVASLWAKRPGSGTVTVQAENSAGVWTTVATLKSNRDGTVSGRLRVSQGVNLRAVQGDQISLPWRTF